jgi:hypothetical protein
MRPEHHAKELLAAYDGAGRLELRTAVDVGFDLSRGYEVADLIRQQRIARGERPLVALRGIRPDLGRRLGHHDPLA